jgi:hypothetical protein
MNIKERNDAILAKLDALRFGHVNHSDEEGKIHKGEQFNPFHFDWNLMVKPPIVSYLQRKTIDDLTSLVTDVRVMNNPAKKYRFMNQILRPDGFKQLASGTNRRAFYCEYDPTIILKIGSDRVGRADNISEYYTQNVIKPFCSKIYDVLPNGIVALCERLEPMSEKEFKTVWSKEIFDLIMNLMYRGYILEDVGGNFYKNWAVRLGFGPALIDFPYVYEIDWGKLKCSYVDPRTGKKCSGELDYDYSKGMSEIVCDTCGSRYSAAYLRKDQTQSYMSSLRKGKKNMKPAFSVKLRRGDQIVHQTVNEVDFIPVTPKPTVKAVGDGVTVDSGNTPTAPVTGAVESNVATETKTSVPAQATPFGNTVTKTHISSEGIGKSHRENVSRNSRYSFNGANSAAKTRNQNNNRPNHNRQPIRDNVMPAVTAFLDSIYESFGKGAVIDLARRLGIYWIDPDKRQKDFTVLPQRTYPGQEGTNNESKESVQKPKEASRNATQQQEAQPNRDNVKEESVGENERDSEEQPKEKKVVINDVEATKQVVTPEPEYKAQTDGLFPVKPMTREELDALDMQNREDNVAMGFPGEPLANTMRMEQYFPQLKKRVEDHLNGFDYEGDEGKVTEYLHDKVIELTADEVARISGTDASGVEVMVNATLDHMNRPCYVVIVENRKSPVFETMIYPIHKETGNQVQVQARHIADGINLLDNPNGVEVTVEAEEVSTIEDSTKEPEDSKVETPEPDGVGTEDFDEFLMDRASDYVDEMREQGSEYDQKIFMIQAMISELMKSGMHFGRSNTIAKKFVSEHYPFNNSFVVNEL